MTLDYFVELSQTTSPQTTEEFSAVYHRLIAAEKKKDADQLRADWSSQALNVQLSEPQGVVWEMIAQPDIDFALLPPSSFALQFTFTLAKPYLSKDDNPFYIIDNPIVREKVFRLPMVRPTSWKGNLHAALWQLGYDKQKDKTMQRLFGDIRSEEGGRGGRLFFYPTFFTQTSLEIINPHDRKRRVGKNPILFESVPANAAGTFSLLYVPFDLVGRDEAEVKKQTLEDLQLIAEGLQAMFLTYGFGAKTSSGFGVAEETVENGTLVLNLTDIVFPQARTSQAQKPDDEYLKYLDEAGKIRSVFEGNGEGGLMSNREYKKEDQQLGGGSLSEFKVFRRWYSEHGEQWQKALKIDLPETSCPTLSFAQFGQLNEILSQMGGE